VTLNTKTIISVLNISAYIITEYKQAKQMFAPLQKKLDAMKKRKEDVDKEMKTKVCIIYLRKNSLVLMLD
jgi:ABC-type Fe3+-hydroxamate transport system substrate-binding protein